MNRNYTEEDVKYWKGILDDGFSRQYVFKGFVDSQEFSDLCDSYKVEKGTYELTNIRDKNPALARYLNRIYVNALGRNGEDGGMNYWGNEILTKKKTPASVAEFFIITPEFEKKNLSNTEYVKVLYQVFMGREADASGLNYWVARLNKGESRRFILRCFAACPEFQKIVAGFGL